MCRKSNIPCGGLIYSVPFVLVFGLFLTSAANAADPDLVGWWKLDEGSGTIAIDSSGNGFDIPLQNTTWENGVFGGAVGFPGEGEGIGGFNYSGNAITVCAWVWHEAFRSGQVERYVTASPEIAVIRKETDGRLHFYISTGGTLRHLWVGNVLTEGQWYHVAGTWDGLTQRLYIDGVEIASQTPGGVLGDASSVRLSNAPEPLNGMLDDVRIYNRALAQDEISGVMLGGGAEYPLASGPDPADDAIYSDIWASLTWKAGDFAVSHNVYMGTSFADVDAGTAGTFIGNVPENDFMDPFLIVGIAGYPIPEGLVPGTRYYWRVDEVNDTDPNSPWKGNVWTFSVPARKAVDPVPGDGAWFVETDVTLAWTTGFGARTHAVYFGDDFDTVNNATGAPGLPFTTFTPAGLEPDKTYYWRVDETDEVFAVHKGDVWSFRTGGVGGGLRGDFYEWTGDFPPPAAFQTFVLSRMDPQVNFSWGTGSPDPLVGTDNFSARWVGEVQAAFTETYTFLTRTDDGARLWVNDQQIIDRWVEQGATEVGGTIDLVAGQRYPIVMEYYENGGDAVAELRWSSPSTPRDFIPQAALSPPVRASSPNPPTGTVGVKMTPTLTWDPGEDGASHQIYFGTDEDAVKNAAPGSPEDRGTRALGDESFEPGRLAWDSVYYWRIDEVNNLHPDSPWTGSVWSFSTGDFLVVDNMETYDIVNRIYAVWLDGLGYVDGDGVFHAGNGSGSEVGDPDPAGSTTEETIVHGGRQSMPYWYNNSGSTGKFNYSEAKLTLSDTRNWTEEGVKALSLWFYGDPANAAEQMYLAVANNAGAPAVVQYAGDARDLKKAVWQEWNVDLREFSGISLTDVDSIAIGFGDRNSPQIGGSGKMYFDDIRLYRTRCVSSLLKPDADLSGNCVVDMADIEIMGADWLLTDSSIAATTPGSPPVGWWKFDNNTNDSAGNNHGTANGFPAYATGIDGQAIDLDGIDDYVDCGSDASLNITGAVTIAVWIKLSGPAADQKIVGNQDGSTGGYKFGLNNNLVEFEIRTSDNTSFLNRSVSGGTVLTPYVWHHVAGVYSQGSYIRTYVDGKLDREMVTTEVLGTTSGTLKIGREPFSDLYFFNGLVDDLQLYDYALSDAEIAGLVDDTPGDGQLYIPVPSAANIYDDEPEGSRLVDFKDFAILADSWLDELLWPVP
jgi:hypothetical protein